MLSYQHGYHAGNFADVVKHLGLTRILSYLKHKEKPFFYLETHSGKGLYVLKDQQATKTLEYKNGIELIWQDRKNLPPIFKDYTQAILALNPEGLLKKYPGSPALAIAALRAQDRAYCCELHPNEYELLKQLPSLNKRMHISNTDGISALKALLPPPERRGFIFIDPSYELKEEYKLIPRAIKQAHMHFATGVYCLWYPVVHRRYVEQLIRGLKDIKAHALHIEFNLTLAPKEGMTGCGLWVINPPYRFEEEMTQALNALKRYFNPGVSSFVIESYGI